MYSFKKKKNSPFWQCVFLSQWFVGNFKRVDQCFSQWQTLQYLRGFFAKWMESNWQDGDYLATDVLMLCGKIKLHLIMWPRAFVFLATVTRSFLTSALATKNWATTGNMVILSSSRHRTDSDAFVVGCMCEAGDLTANGKITGNNTTPYSLKLLPAAFGG